MVFHGYVIYVLNNQMVHDGLGMFMVICYEFDFWNPQYHLPDGTAACHCLIKHHPPATSPSIWRGWSEQKGHPHIGIYYKYKY